jgi:hypothetical protein
MTKGRAVLPLRVVAEQEPLFITFGGSKAHEPQISPLRYPGFPVENRGVDRHHAVFFKENHRRGRCQQRGVGNPGTLRSR